MDAKSTVQSMPGIRLSHPDRILYREQGITKRELAGYLDSVAERMLRYCGGRLISLVRCPKGRSKKCFFQRHADSSFPDDLHRIEVPGKNGKEEYLYLTGKRGLIAAAQLGVLEFHIWGSRADDAERPDRIVFDLDPGPSVTFNAVKAAAKEIRDALEELDLSSFPLLTGGKGIHVVAPILRLNDWPTVQDFTRSLAERLADQQPDRYTATMSKEKHGGRIFIDYLRNSRGASAIAPYSPRARRNAPVAWPVSWKELNDVAAANVVTIENAGDKLRAQDPWSDYGALRQGLKAASLRAFGVRV